MGTVASRKVFIAGFTANPNEQWMQSIAQMLIAPGGFLAGMKHLILDRDGKFAPSFRNLLDRVGGNRGPPPSAKTPNLNAFAERFVRSIKEEYLDHLLLFGEASLQRTWRTSSSITTTNARIRGRTIRSCYASIRQQPASIPAPRAGQMH